MEAVHFESVEKVSREEFVHFVEARERLHDYYHYELLNGRIVMNPPAGFPHGNIGSRMGLVLSGHVVPRKLGWVFDSSQGFDLPGGDTVQPDGAFISNARWKKAPKPIPGTFLRVVPDLVVEIFSKSTGEADRNEKKKIYEHNGVREYWIIDWRTRRLLAFHLKRARFASPLTVEHGKRYTSFVLPELTFKVSELFS